MQPPLRILVTISAPHGLPELDAEQEQAKLLESLAGLIERGAVTVECTSDATLRTLQSTLRRARSEGRPYHVWHYIGHGAFMQSRSASVLAFCTPQNQLHRVGDLELGTLFDGYPEMRLVLLNACEGARPDPQDPFAGVAAALVRRGVPAVIGMQIEISDEAAKTLSQVFYEALVDGLPVDAALTEARRAVFFTPNWTEWATPVLYMRAPDGRIFDVSALAPRPDGTQPVRTSTRVQESERRARSAQLAALYTDARAAYYTSRWERAIELLDEIVSIQADYERAADMLQEAKRRHTLAERYTRGSEAYEAREWDEAIEHLEAVIALEPGHEAAAVKLEDARRQKSWPTCMPTPASCTRRKSGRLCSPCSRTSRPSNRTTPTRMGSRPRRARRWRPRDARAGWPICTTWGCAIWTRPGGLRLWSPLSRSRSSNRATGTRKDSWTGRAPNGRRRNGRSRWPSAMPRAAQPTTPGTGRRPSSTWKRWSP